MHIHIQGTEKDFDLSELNKKINQRVNQFNADCILDYWHRKDPSYVNGMAPCMGYVECPFHNPHIGFRPYGGDTLCSDCGEEMERAVRLGVVTVRELEETGGWGANSAVFRKRLFQAEKKAE